MVGLGNEMALSLRSSIGLRFLLDCWLMILSVFNLLGLLILLSLEELNDVSWC